MAADASQLFTLIKTMLNKGKSTVEVGNAITADEELLAVSNSYCAQCGDCCSEEALQGADERKGDCRNKEVRVDGLAYCLLHCDPGVYPHGKRIAEIRDAADKRLDPTVWAKPLVCHRYGPYVVILTEVVDPSLMDLVRCPGGRRMLADYHAFNEQR